MSICSLEKCENKELVWGLCEKHYNERRSKGKIKTHIKQKQLESCLIEECGKDTYKKGLCETHYDRYKYGRPLIKRIEPCLLEGCLRDSAVRGLCKSHYNILNKQIKKKNVKDLDEFLTVWEPGKVLGSSPKKKRSPNKLPKPPMTEKLLTHTEICIVPHCGDSVRSRNLCHKHYVSWYRVFRNGKVTTMEEFIEYRIELEDKKNTTD